MSSAALAHRVPSYPLAAGAGGTMLQRNPSRYRNHPPPVFFEEAAQLGRDGIDLVSSSKTLGACSSCLCFNGVHQQPPGSFLLPVKLLHHDLNVLHACSDFFLLLYALNLTENIMHVFYML